MVRRGRCRCGEVLKFRRGPDGYKCRCPRCGAVVRLRAPETKERQPRRRIQCTCGTVVLAGKHTPQICPTCRRPLVVTEETVADAPPLRPAALPGTPGRQAGSGVNIVPRGQGDMILAPEARPAGLLHSPLFWIALAALLIGGIIAAAGFGLLVWLNS